MAGPVENARYGVGRSHAQVVVAMGGDDGFVDAVHVFFEKTYFPAEFFGQTISGRVGNIYDCGSGFDDGFDDTCQIFIVGTSGIFGIELYVLNILLCIFYGGDGAFYDFFPGGIELVFDVVVRCSDTRVDTFVLGILQGFGSDFYVVFIGAGQRTDGGPRYGFGDGYDRVEVARARYGKSRFDDIYPQCFESLGHFYFLYGVQLTTRHLLAVAQGCIEDV